VGEDAQLLVVPDSLPQQGRQIVRDRMRIFQPADPIHPGNLKPEEIGQVSDQSRPYHELHVARMQQRGHGLLSCPILACDDTLLIYMRSRHPLKETRVQCNVLIGLRQFCRAQVLSGHAALCALNDSLESGSTPKQSLHQKEIFLAIKLLLLAARRDNFAYGVNYCKSLMMRAPTTSRSLQRTLRIYKLISYLFPYMQYMIQSGQMRFQVTEAIQNELEDREIKKYKYRRQESIPPTLPIDAELESLILGDNLDRIFMGLEQYAQSLVELGDGLSNTGTLAETLQASNLVFDIGIEERVNKMIQKLGLLPTGPRNIIDLGDTDIIEADDW
jgi:hypothetical protein